MPTTTDAVLISAPGGPEAMRPGTTDLADPGPGELLVETIAAGVNFIDTYQRSGLYPVPMPAVLGLEGAGRVVSTGPDVDTVAVGDVVAWLDVPGSYARHVLVPAARAVAVPDGIDPQVAAAAMLQGVTAHYLVTGTHRLAAGEVAVVHAAAGGVGLLLCQLGRRAGARVLGTAGDAAKADLARAAGADEVLAYREEDWVARVRELTGGRGADVVYDGVGQATFAGGLDALRPRGLMVSFGNASGPVEPFSPLLLSQKGSLFLTRPTIAHYVTGPELHERAGAVLGLVATGELDVRIGERLPLEQAARAHELLEGRRTTGKVILLPS